MSNIQASTLCPICLQYRWTTERERKDHNRDIHKVRQGEKLKAHRPVPGKNRLGKILIERADRADYISW